MNVVFLMIFSMMLYSFTRNVLFLIFNMDNYRIHKIRQKQMKFKSSGQEEPFIVDQITKPFIKHVLSHFVSLDDEAMKMRLHMAKWDKMTPASYKAINIMLKIVGVIMFLLFRNESLVFGLVWAVPLFFSAPIFLYNAYSDRRALLIKHFPDFITITEGYLNANIPFADAVLHSTKFLHPEWRAIANRFVTKCNTRGVDEALETLKAETDIFEVREFVSLVKLTLEQGGDTKDSFAEQAGKVEEMYLDAMYKEIGKRKLMMIAVQGPLLIAIMASFGLPTVVQMMGIGSL